MVFKKKPNYRGGEVIRITEIGATSQSHINHICFKLIKCIESIPFSEPKIEINKILNSIMNEDCKNSNYEEAIKNIREKRVSLNKFGDFIRKEAPQKYSSFRRHILTLKHYI